MSKRVVELFVVDILVAINKISRYHTDFSDAETFYYDEKSFDATMRELQIIGEATNHLISANILSTEYRIIVDFRNLIVHEYFGIDADEIWDILHNELPIFQETMLKLMKNTLDNNTILEILFFAQEDLKNRGDTVAYLKKLEKYVTE